MVRIGAPVCSGPQAQSAYFMPPPLLNGYGGGLPELLFGGGGAECVYADIYKYWTWTVRGTRWLAS